MAKVCVIGLAVVSVLSILGCERRHGMDPRSVPFTNVEDYGNFVVRQKGTTVMKSDSVWMDFWELHWNCYDGSGNRTPPPEIDFEADIVIGVFWGDGYSGCTNKSPSIETVLIMCGTMYVVVGEMIDLGPCHMMVEPLHLIQVQRHDLPIEFVGHVP